MNSRKIFRGDILNRRDFWKPYRWHHWPCEMQSSLNGTSFLSINGKSIKDDLQNSPKIMNWLIFQRLFLLEL